MSCVIVLVIQSFKKRVSLNLALYKLVVLSKKPYKYKKRVCAVVEKLTSQYQKHIM